MKKIIIIQERIPHYRRALFNELAKHFVVKVIHSLPYETREDDNFVTMSIPLRKMLRLRLQLGAFNLISKEAPFAVIASTNPRNVINYILMMLLMRKVKWVWWGLEKSKNKFVNLFYQIMMSPRNPVIFYNKELKCNYTRYHGNMPGFFVANNTVHIENSEDLSTAEKDIFLNVGSLQQRKKNIKLISAFKVWHEKSKNTKIRLVLIGDGPEMEHLKRHVKTLNLNEFVELAGEIQDPKILKEFYQRAFAAISYGQAGLAVLQSFAFGVPYITGKDAISGGEKFNIVHGYNGLLINQNIDPFSSVFELFTNDRNCIGTLVQMHTDIIRSMLQ